MEQVQERMGEQSADDLINSLASEYTITRSELARWHRAGLLPRPRRCSLGRGRGMESLYPLGTGEQLRALCRIHQTERRLVQVAWRLWWEGYAVPLEVITPMLEQACQAWQQGLEELARLQVNPEEFATQLERGAIQRTSRKVLTRVRKRIGRQRFPHFIEVLARIGSGTFTGYTDASVAGKDERWIVERGFGLDRAQKNRLADAPPWVTGDVSLVFVELSARLREYPFGAVLQGMSDTALQRDRDEVRVFFSSLAEMSRIFDMLFSPGAFGFSIFADIFEDCGPQDQAMLVLFWRLMRSWGFGPNMDQLLGVARQWQAVWFPLFVAVQQLRQEVPATAEVLAPKQFGFALRWKLTMEGLLDVTRRFAQDPEVQAFFAQHPEVETALTWQERLGRSEGQAASEMQAEAGPDRPHSLS